MKCSIHTTNKSSHQHSLSLPLSHPLPIFPPLFYSPKLAKYVISCYLIRWSFKNRRHLGWVYRNIKHAYRKKSSIFTPLYRTPSKPTLLTLNFLKTNPKLNPNIKTTKKNTRKSDNNSNFTILVNAF